MKRILIKMMMLLCLTAGQSVLAAPSGQFFDVDVTSTTITTSTVTNQFYTNAGVRIDTPGFSLAEAGVECQLLSNGFCLFSVSKQKPVTISFEGVGSQVGFTLCLNGKGPLGCEKHSVPLTLFVTTLAGNVAESVDHGVTWTLAPSKPDGSPVNGIALLKAETLLGLSVEPGFPEPVRITATESGNVLSSNNRGFTWTTLTPPDSGSPVFDLVTDSSATLLLVGTGSGKVMRSYDRGLSWSGTPKNPDGSAVYGVDFIGNQTGAEQQLLASTADGHVAFSSDGGREWILSTPFLDAVPVFDISASANNVWYAGSGLGQMAVSYDLGRTWVQVVSPNETAVNGIRAQHQAVSYVGTALGDVLYSSDFGGSWMRLSASPDGTEVIGINSFPEPERRP